MGLPLFYNHLKWTIPKPFSSSKISTQTTFWSKELCSGSKKHCTAKLQKQLKDNYEYDGEGYAIWNFRTGMQDGPSDISKVTSVTALGNGLYKVNFIDMGIKGNRTLKIIDVNGTLKFDAIR